MAGCGLRAIVGHHCGVAFSFPASRAGQLEDDFAERLLRRFLGWCDDPRNQSRSLQMVMGALRQRGTARIGFWVLNKVVVNPFFKASGAHPGTARMQLVGAQLFALAMLRYRLKLEPIASMSAEELIPLYAPAIRAILNAAPGMPLDQEYVELVSTDWGEPDLRRQLRMTGRFG